MMNKAVQSLIVSVGLLLGSLGCQGGTVGHEAISQCYPEGACDEAMFTGGLKGGVANPEAGSALYVQYCASCHGADGVGKDTTHRINFTSAVWHASMTDEAIANAVLRGKPPMMPAVLLNEVQLRDLLGHLRGLKKGTAPPPVSPPSAAPSGSGY